MLTWQQSDEEEHEEENDENVESDESEDNEDIGTFRLSIIWSDIPHNFQTFKQFSCQSRSTCISECGTPS